MNNIIQENNRLKGRLEFDDHKLLYHLKDVMDWLEGKPIVPLHIDLGPTKNCNIRCIYCFSEYQPGKDRYLPRDVYVNLIKDAGRLGIKSIAIIGEGEPLMNKHTPEAIIEGKKAGVDLGLATNGVLLKKEEMEDILRSLVWIRFNLSASNPENYKKIHRKKPELFYTVIENIKKTVEIKKEKNLPVTIGVQTVLIPEILNDLIDLTKLSKEIGVDYFEIKQWSFNQNNRYKFELDWYTKANEVLKKAESLSDKNFKVIVKWNYIKSGGVRSYNKCYALPFLIQVSGDGCVYTCAHFFGEERFKYGDLRVQSLEEILNSERYKTVMNDIIENYDVHTCPTCCRHENINRFLWKLVHPPAHVNFI